MSEELPQFLGQDFQNLVISDSDSKTTKEENNTTKDDQNLFGLHDENFSKFLDSPFFPSDTTDTTKTTDHKGQVNYTPGFGSSQFFQQFSGYEANDPSGTLWNGFNSPFTTSSGNIGSSEGSSEELYHNTEDQRNDLHSPDLFFPPFSSPIGNSPFQQRMWNTPGSIYVPPQTILPEDTAFSQYNQFGGPQNNNSRTVGMNMGGGFIDDTRTSSGSRMQMRNPVRNTSMFAPPRQPTVLMSTQHPGGGQRVLQNHEYPPQGSSMIRTPHHHRSSSVDSYIGDNDSYSNNHPKHGNGNQSRHYISPPHTPNGHVSEPNRINVTSGCRYFANGYCSHGDRCNFDHILPNNHHIDNDRDPMYPIGNPPSSSSSSSTYNGQYGRGGRRGNVRNINQPSSDDKKTLCMDLTKLTSLDQAAGQVYAMCKDQHGCRFLQKKLEEKEKNYEAVNMIFDEVYDHMVELMTDPFGNYLCQKLIEHCDEQQQLLIVQKVSPKLVEISKNMHGTRAVQKMIECLCTPSQVQLVVNALKSSVVSLIQDLNGNHVIQRCLNRLSYRDKQFIYDAVANNAIEVATHRHGCCVMQRCIDSANEPQKLQLVRQISRNALTLVKDQFGNYVVQYVLDLDFDIVRIQLIQEFCGHIAELSTQKFSSNVIEKCLRVAVVSVQTQIIEEIMQPNVLSLLLQDPFGNYVIQTALSIARPEQYSRLVEEIKPLLSTLRNTPYGKRIQNKIAKDCIDRR